MTQTATDISNEVLDSIETEKVLLFKGDPMMFQAVKKYILAVAYKHGVMKAGEEHKANINYALQLANSATQPNGLGRSDEELGQNLRALTYAVQLVESGFKEMAEMVRTESVEELTVNPSE